MRYLPPYTPAIQIGPIHISSSHLWWIMLFRGRNWFNGFQHPYCGIFRNGDYRLRGRWGFYFYGFEFGSRNPDSRFGLWMKRVGIWPW